MLLRQALAAVLGTALCAVTAGSDMSTSLRGYSESSDDPMDLEVVQEAIHAFRRLEELDDEMTEEELNELLKKGQVQECDDNDETAEDYDELKYSNWTDHFLQYQNMTDEELEELWNQTNTDLLEDERLDPFILEELQANNYTMENLEIMILEKVYDAGDNDQEVPEMEDILELLSIEMGYEEDVLEDYIETFDPLEGKHILDAYNNATQEVRTRKVNEFVELFLDTMIDELADGRPIEGVLKDLDLDPHELDEALEAFAHPDVTAALKEAELLGAAKMKEYLVEVEHLDNTTVDNTTVRMLEVDPVAELEAEAFAYEESLKREHHARKLRRVELFRNTNKFLARFQDHTKILQNHGHRLLAEAPPCPEGMPKIQCSQAKLEQMVDDFGRLNTKVTNALAPLSKLLGKVGDTTDDIQDLKLVASVVTTAVKIAEFIPAGIGKAFRPVVDVMETIKPKVDKMGNRADDLEDEVVKRWNLSIGKLTQLFDSFESALETSNGVANFFTKAKENSCMFQFLSEATEGKFQDIESSINTFTDYSESLFEKSERLVDALKANAWKRTNNALDDMLDAVKPILKFFNPFKPLAGVLKEEIDIPWFNGIKDKKRLGLQQCDSGYKLGAFNQCYEKPPKDWQEWDLGISVKRKCTGSGEKFRTDWLGNCERQTSTKETIKMVSKKIKKRITVKTPWKKYKTTVTVTIKVPLGTCKDGWKGPYLFRCFKKTCPHKDLTLKNSRPDICYAKKRKKNSRNSNCNKWKNDGIPTLKGLFGDCYRKCGNGDIDVGLFCFATSKKTFTIKGIANALKKILKQIESTPVYKLINDGINSVVKPIMNFILKLIKPFLDVKRLVPDLPSVDVDELPFDEFDFDIPETPGVNLDLDFSSKFMDKIKEISPFDISACGADGIDAECLMDAVGAPSLNETLEVFDSMYTDVYTDDALENVSSVLIEIAPLLKCTKWNEHEINLGNKMMELGLTKEPCKKCNYKVPVCAGIDFGGEEALEGIQKSLEAKMWPLALKILNRTASNEEERRLFENPSGERELQHLWDKGQKWMPILPVPISIGVGIDEGKGVDGSKWEAIFIQEAGREDGYRGDQYVQGAYFQFLLKFRLEFGLNYQDWQKSIVNLFNYDNFADTDKKNSLHDLGLLFGVDVELKFSKTGSINLLLANRRRWVERMRDIKTWRDVEDGILKVGENWCWTADSTIQGGKNKYLSDDASSEVRLLFPAYPKAKWPRSSVCDALKETYKKVARKTPSCEPDDMDKWVDYRLMSERRAAMTCIKLWWRVQRETEQEIRLIKHKMAKIEGTAVIPTSWLQWKWNTAKGMYKNNKNMKNWKLFKTEYISNSIISATDSRPGARKRQWFSMMRNPNDSVEYGLELQFDDEMRFFGFNNFQASWNGMKLWKEERARYKPQLIPTEPRANGNRQYRFRSVETVPSYKYGISVWCQVDFTPKQGLIRNAMYCPGFGTVGETTSDSSDDSQFNSTVSAAPSLAPSEAPTEEEEED